MIVLGIDPGLASTGYGVVEAGARARAPSGQAAGRRAGRPHALRAGACAGLVALDAGVIRTDAQAPAESRLAEIHAEVRALLAEHGPDAMALEELYFGQNARTAFAVGQGRGAAMLAAGQQGVPCASYTPQQVKAAVCGSGGARKEQVSNMVAALLGVVSRELPDHASDALAVAICHANRAPLASSLAEALR